MRIHSLSFLGLGLSLVVSACTITTSDGDSDRDSGPGAGGGSSDDGGSGGSSGGSGGKTGGSGGSDDGGIGGTGDDGGTGGSDDDGGPGSGGTSDDGGPVDMDGGAPEGGDAGPVGEPYVETCETDGDNDTVDLAVPLTSTAQICVTEDDSDWFRITAPDDGKAHVARIDIEQDTGTRMQVTAYADADDSEMGTFTLQESVERTFYLTVGPGSTTQIDFSHYFGDGLADLTLTWSTENDPYEPNNTRDDAAEIELDTDVEAQLIIPYTADDDQTSSDWYRIELAADTTTLSVTDVPENVRMQFTIYDPTFDQVGTMTTPNEGALFSDTFEAESAGTYYIRLNNYFSDNFGPFIDSGTPAHLSETYTIRITQ